MKRVIAGLTAALATALLSAAPAQAAAQKDPLAALRAQLAAGKGVSYTQRSFDKKERLLDVKGSLAFDRAGIAASDITVTPRYDDKRREDPFQTAGEQRSRLLSSPERTIRIGTTAYLKGEMIAEGLPAGKTWWKQAPGWTSGHHALFGEVVNAAEPATLKALLAKATRSGNTYRGKISVAELRKVSPWTRATMWWKSKPGATIAWTLTVAPSGLPRKLVTTGTAGPAARVETSFTGWGTKVSIKAPPAREVTTELIPEQMYIYLPLPKAPKG